jgi:hypothetical protein
MSSVIYKQPYTNVMTLPRQFFGRMLFVDSTYGSNDNIGTNIQKPLKSINYAMDKCADTNDDVIIVLNGYNNDDTDSLTDGDDTPITIDKNRTAVLFAGRNNIVQAIESGDSIFKIDADGVVLGVLPGGEIHVAAAKAGSTSSVVEFSANAVMSIVEGFRTDSLDGYDELITIPTTGKKHHIRNCDFIGDTTDTDEGITLTGTPAQITIEDCRFYECCAGNGAIYASGGIGTNIIVKNCIADTRTASKKGCNFSTNCTGALIKNNLYVEADANGCVNGTGMCEFSNYVNDAETTNGFPGPAVGTT